jgi:hypothetical protein
VAPGLRPDPWARRAVHRVADGEPPRSKACKIGSRGLRASVTESLTKRISRLFRVEGCKIPDHPNLTFFCPAPVVLDCG